MPITIGELLARRAALMGEHTALITSERVWSYGRLDAYVARLAQVLIDANVRPGDRIAVALRNGAEYVGLYYAAARVGAILVGINWRLATPEIAHILADCAPRLVVCSAEFVLVVETASKGLAIRLLSVGCGATGHERLEDHIERAQPFAGTSDVAPDAPLAICYTSGTTGRSKGAVLTHAQMFWAAETIGSTVDYRTGDVNLIATPLFHVGGLSFATLFSARGAAVVMPPAWVPEGVIEAIESQRVDHFFAVPAMLESLLAAVTERGEGLARLRWIMTGAAPLPLRLIEAFRSLGVPVLQSYGATETAGPATCVDLDHVGAKAGSIGRPFFYSDVRVVRSSGEPAVPEEIGELQVRGPHVFAGYWNDPEATHRAFANGWLVTGDVGYRDAEGFFYLVDRKKDLIISGGENVYPAEVELVLAEHPAIAEVAVVGVPDARWGEAVCAVVVQRTGHTVDLAAISAHCQGRIARYKIPTRLVISERALPRNATGKVLKSAVRAAVKQQRA